jgi:hypothetical protein
MPAWAFFLVVAGSPLPAVAHHPGGISGARLLVEGSQAGYNAILEVLPADPTVGNAAEFFLYVTPDGPSGAYTGQARLWIRNDPPPAAPPMIIPLVERGRGAVSVVYGAGHRFERDGVYRVEVDLESLQARWAGSLRVVPATSWVVRIAQVVALLALVSGFVLFLGWWSNRVGRTP